MKLKFYDNNKGKLIVEQDKDNGEELIKALTKGKEVNLLYLDNNDLKSIKGIYSHYTRTIREEDCEDTICLYLDNVSTIDN